jgi:hypothetical protein
LPVGHFHVELTPDRHPDGLALTAGSTVNPLLPERAAAALRARLAGPDRDERS